MRRNPNGVAARNSSPRPCADSMTCSVCGEIPYRAAFAQTAGRGWSSRSAAKIGRWSRHVRRPDGLNGGSGTIVLGGVALAGERDPSTSGVAGGARDPVRCSVAARHAVRWAALGEPPLVAATAPLMPTAALILSPPVARAVRLSAVSSATGTAAFAQRVWPMLLATTCCPRRWTVDA